MLSVTLSANAEAVLSLTHLLHITLPSTGARGGSLTIRCLKQQRPRRTKGLCLTTIYRGSIDAETADPGPNRRSCPDQAYSNFPGCYAIPQREGRPVLDRWSLTGGFLRKARPMAAVRSPFWVSSRSAHLRSNLTQGSAVCP